MSKERESLPLDSDALELYLEALDSVIVDVDSEGNPVMSGEFDLPALLEFYSGYEAERSESVGDGVFVYRGGAIYSTSDLIRALIGEIKRLRGLNNE